MPRAERCRDPYAAYRFRLEVGGLTVAGFSECSGLPAESGAIGYREGDENPIVPRLPGMKHSATVTLKRGFTESTELLEWLNTVDGQSEPRSGSIVLRNEAGEEIMRWNFHEGSPSKWGGPRRKATDNEVAIETLEITVEGLALE